MSVDMLLKDHRDEILEIAKLHGATNVRVFGSVARGEAGPDSDVDFLVDLESGRSLLDLAKLLVDLEHLLNRRVDVVTEKGLRAHVKEPILTSSCSIVRDNRQRGSERTYLAGTTSPGSPRLPAAGNAQDAPDVSLATRRTLGTKHPLFASYHGGLTSRWR